MTAGPPRLYCRCSPVVDRRFDGDTSPTVAVAEALAAAEGVDPTDLEPLNDAIDCAAFDRLFDGGELPTAAPKVLSFAVDGWNVFVRDDGSVRVCDPDPVVEPEPVFERSIGD